MLQTGHCNPADYPAPQEGDWIARAFRFNTGEVMSDVRLHYRTIGAPSGEPVLVLHGTTDTGASMLTPGFANRHVAVGLLGFSTARRLGLSSLLSVVTSTTLQQRSMAFCGACPPVDSART